MATYEKHHCWSILLRLFHWMFVLSIISLVTTGFYINNPWTNTMIEGGTTSLAMTYMRYIHFIAAYTFASAVAIRLFLYIFGNKQERILDILPVTGRNIKNLYRILLHYSYISDSHDDRLGHNILAGASYLITYFAALFMILSGFYMLYPEVPFWQTWGSKLLVSQQWARFLHHCVMWWFLLFVVIHFYFLIWNDAKHPEGLISSMFTGVKFKQKA
ncbi:MAG: Ni/Fe-hydrogenase, b-type cytochrome subunit [Desulfobulbaceae bacterium S3730MH12]|nr:MAG: Ni/Fe-hydrogenase, b-type cytochrome subunit [Desulfobulbaceae bacterium S3730MH12]